MSIQEVQVEIDNEQKQDNKKKIEECKVRYEKELSLLRLEENPNIKKWIQRFVIEPLEKLEEAHDKETKTNENFILKGQVFRLKKIKNWAEEHKKVCDRYKRELESLRGDQ